MQRNYIIIETVGFGGSCLAYRAERETAEYESRICMPNIPVIIKEFYPVELAESITRKTNGELIAEKVSDTFDLLKRRFEHGATEQTVFSVNDGNHSLPLPSIAVANGTLYTAVALNNGQTLTDCAASLSTSEKADVLTSLCNAVKKLHNSEKLYLDLKPSNIFVFDKELNESRRIALFDFDTVVTISALSEAVISYSVGWSPYEQVNWKKDEISFAADIYTIGALYYWLLSGSEVSDIVLDEIVRGRFAFLDEVDELRGSKRLKETASQILSATLKRMPSKRVQRVEDILL